MAGKSIIQLDPMYSPISSQVVFAVNDPLDHDHTSKAYKATASALGSAMFDLINWPLSINSMEVKGVTGAPGIGNVTITLDSEFATFSSEEDVANMATGDYITTETSPNEMYEIVGEITPTIKEIYPKGLASKLDSFTWNRPLISVSSGELEPTTTRITPLRFTTNSLDAPTIDTNEITASSGSTINFNNDVYASNIKVGASSAEPSEGEISAEAVETNELLIQDKIRLKEISSQTTGVPSITIDQTTGAPSFPGLGYNQSENNSAQYLPDSATYNIRFQTAIVANQISTVSPNYDTFTLTHPGLYQVCTSVTCNLPDSVPDYNQIQARITLNSTNIRFARKIFKNERYGDLIWIFNESATFYITGTTTLKVRLTDYIAGPATEIEAYGANIGIVQLTGLIS